MEIFGHKENQKLFNDYLKNVRSWVKNNPENAKTILDALDRGEKIQVSVVGGVSDPKRNLVPRGDLDLVFNEKNLTPETYRAVSNLQSGTVGQKFQPTLSILEDIQAESAAKYGKSTTQVPVEKKIFSEIRSAYNNISPKDIPTSGAVSFPREVMGVRGSLPSPPAEIVINEPVFTAPKTASAAGRDLMPAARTLARALGTDAVSLGGMALRGVGRLAGPIGTIATMYDAATIIPSELRDWMDRPTYISDPNAEAKIRSQAIDEYRTGPRTARGVYSPATSYYAPTFPSAQ